MHDIATEPVSSSFEREASFGIASTGAMIIALLEYRRAYLIARSAARAAFQYRLPTRVHRDGTELSWMPFYSIRKSSSLTV
jgi:hypothetical protein